MSKWKFEVWDTLKDRQESAHTHKGDADRMAIALNDKCCPEERYVVRDIVEIKDLGPSDYDIISRLGYVFENSPRSNPENRLDQPFRIRDMSAGKTVLRGESRDDLEMKMHRWLDKCRLVPDDARGKKLGASCH